MAEQDNNNGTSFWSKAYWTDEDPWPYLKRTLAVLFLTVVLRGAFGFVV